jgi:hypothetical protein
VTEEQEATMSTGISIALIAVGAVLTFALEREAEGVNSTPSGSS